MKKIFFLLSMLVAYSANSQTPLWQWINVAGSQGDFTLPGLVESTKNLGSDAFGNLYGISALSSSSRYIDTIYQQYGFGYDDFCVFSYRCDGAFRWVRFYGSYNNDWPGGMIVSPQGDVYVCGAVIVGPYSDAHFGDTIIYQNSTYAKASFLSKLDSTGNTQWLNLPGPNFNYASNRFIGIDFNSQGNIQVIAWLQDSTTWNGFSFPNQGHYIITFDNNNGNIIKVVELQLKQSPIPLDLRRTLKFSFDTDNNMYLSFEFADTIIVGQDTVTRPNVSGANLSILAKFDSTGQKIWHQAVGGVFSVNPNSTPYQLLTGKPLIHNNMIYIAGETQSHPGSEFMGVPVINPIAYNNGLRTKVIARFNKHTGAFVGATNFWHKHVISNPVLLAHGDKIYWAGGSGHLIILNQTDTVQPFTNNNLGHLYFIAVDTALNIFNYGIGASVYSGGVWPQITSALIDNNGNIILGGDINGPVVSSLGDTSQIIGGSTDFFIAKIATTNTNCGCKPADPKPQMVSLYNKVLTVQGTTTIGADSLAWFWGDGTSTPYTQPGTTVSHTYQQGGNYTVCLRAWNICGVADSCFQVLNVGVNELVIQNPELVIYPNPFKEALNIELPVNMTDAQIILYDLAGKQVLNMNVTGNNHPKTVVLDTSTLEPGIYVIQLVSRDGGRFVGKVVKK